MHDIEPYFRWRDFYVAEEDDKSPFFEREYSEFTFSNKVYNFFIHPQWDDFGSETLYLKVLFVDYDDGYAIIELLGEWNDAVGNDIMFLKRDVIDEMIEKEVFKFILIGENILNFHSSDDSYYEEWWDDISDERGWVVLLNTLQHVTEEMQRTGIQHFINLGKGFDTVNWRPQKPERLYEAIETIINGQVQQMR
jgi:hypothetical protein